MTKHRFLATVLWASLAALPVQAAVESALPRSEVPIRQVTLSDGMRRYSIPIKVGATEIDAGLDSGSTGLRVLPGVLGAADVKAGGKASRYSYGSGAKLDGVIGEGVLRIGALAAPSTLQLVREVGCTDALPNCPAGKVALKDYGVQGDGLRGEGFKAIIGINMAEAEVRSPLTAVGARHWIIELPLDERRPGRLVLNPTPDEMAGYTFFKIDPQFRQMDGGMHDAIAACLANTGARQTFCGPALLDTGDPGLTVLNAGGGRPWGSDTPAAMAFMAGGKAVTAAALVIGRREFASNLRYVAKDSGGVRLHLGIAPYFAYSVLYDPAAGQIGLKPRPDSPMKVQQGGG